MHTEPSHLLLGMFTLKSTHPSDSSLSFWIIFISSANCVPSPARERVVNMINISLRGVRDQKQKVNEKDKSQEWSAVMTIKYGIVRGTREPLRVREDLMQEKHLN